MTRAAWRQELTGLLWTSPWLLGAAVFMFLPMGLSLYYSLTDYPLIERPLWTGLSNYQQLAGDPTFWRVVGNTAVYVAWTVPLGTALGVVLAAILAGRLQFSRVYQACVFIPTLVPVMAGAMVWMWLFNGEYGLINKVGQPVLDWVFGIAGRPAPRMPTWLVDQSWVMPSLVVMSLWGVGQSVVIFIAAMQDVPAHLYEAARLDGMSPRRQFWHVTLPMISPQILFTTIVATINAVQVFAVPFVLFRKPDGQNPAGHFYSMYLYENAFVYGRMGYACAMAWIQMLVVVALTGLMFWASRRLVHYRGGA